ncbi:MAG: YbaY family lipoprotein [Rhodospirillales bacterium]|nr:YbaY family lipoprotein [Rhodospirillales bacterium]
MNRRGTGVAFITGAVLVTALVVACSPRNGSRSDGVDAVVASADASSSSVEVQSGPRLSGMVTYVQRIALPRDADVIVSLLDLSTTATPPSPIAIRQFKTAGLQVPIRFNLPFDPARVESGHVYAVQVRIEVDGALWFTNEPPLAVQPNDGPDDLRIVVHSAARTS